MSKRLATWRSLGAIGEAAGFLVDQTLLDFHRKLYHLDELRYLLCGVAIWQFIIASNHIDSGK